MKIIIKYSFALTVFLFSLYLPFTFIYSNDNTYINRNNPNEVTYKNGLFASSFTSSTDTNKFILGMIHNGIESADKYYFLTDSLLCNTWHKYGNWTRGPLWFKGDSLNAPLSVYGD